MKCIGVRENHRLYYDTKHDEYLLMTPNFRFTRMMGHCNNCDVSEWAYKTKEKHKKLIQDLMSKDMSDNERYKEMVQTLGRELGQIKYYEYLSLQRKKENEVEV